MNELFPLTERIKGIRIQIALSLAVHIQMKQKT